MGIPTTATCPTNERVLTTKLRDLPEKAAAEGHWMLAWNTPEVYVAVDCHCPPERRGIETAAGLRHMDGEVQQDLRMFVEVNGLDLRLISV